MTTISAACDRRLRACALAVLALLAGAASAQSVSPVLVELSPRHRVGSVTIANRSDRGMSFQVEVRAWSQPDGVDRYAPTEDLLVAPAIADIGPGDSQLFRVALRTPPPSKEFAYRLVFENVTQETRAPAANKVSVTINFSHDLPVFVGTPTKAKGKPRLGVCAGHTGAGCVRLDNDGTRRVKISSLVVEGGGWRKPLATAKTILAGAWAEWRFDLPAKARRPLRVLAETSEGRVTFDVPAPMD